MPASAQTTFSYDEFSNLSDFELSGSTEEVVKDPKRGKALRITSAHSSTGGAFYKKPIDLSQNSSFSSYFSFRIHEPRGEIDEADKVQGADGLLFVVQTTSNQIGEGGAGIGYGGLKNSLAIEFDTWKNDYDPDGNHVGININGEMKSLVTKHIQPPLNNGKVWHAWVDYDGKRQLLEVRLSTTEQRPYKPTLRHKLDLPNTLKQQRVYVGFTAGTAASGNIHDVLRWHFRGQFSPIGGEQSLQVIEDTPHTLIPDQLGIIFDASGSMRARISKKETRIMLAQRAMREVLDEIPDHVQIGWMAFGHRYRSKPHARSCRDIEMLVPFADNNKAAIQRAIQNIRPRGETPIGRALWQIGQQFQRNRAKKWIIVLTDGIETCDPTPRHPHYPLQVIRDLRKQGIDLRVNLVGFGIRQQTTHRLLLRIAQQGGGIYLQAQKEQDLRRSLRNALTTPVLIRDHHGRLLAQTSLNGSEVALESGNYRIDVMTQPPLLDQPVTLHKNQPLQLRLAYTNGSFQLLQPPAPPRITAPTTPQTHAPRTMPQTTTVHRSKQPQHPPQTHAPRTTPQTTLAPPPTTPRPSAPTTPQPATTTTAPPKDCAAAPKHSDALYAWFVRHFSFEVYEGSLRGVSGVCASKAGNSVDLSILLAAWLKERGKTVRIASAKLSDTEQAAVFQAFVQQHRLRWKTYQEAIDANHSFEDAVAAVIERMDTFADIPYLRGLLQNTPSLRKVWTALALQRFLRERPEDLYQGLMEEVEKVWPQQTEQVKRAFSAQTDALRAMLREHTWVQYKQGEKWVDLDPTLRLPMGRSLRAAQQLLSFDAFLQTLPTHRLRFELTATFQAGNQRKNITLLDASAPAHEWAKAPIILRFSPTAQKFDQSPLTSAIQNVLSANEGGLPYQPLLLFGTKVITGAPLRIKDWRPTKAHHPSLLGLDEKAPPASQRPELARITLALHHTSPDGQTNTTRRILLERVGAEQARSTGAWTLVPLHPHHFATLRAIRVYHASGDTSTSSRLPAKDVPSHPFLRGLSTIAYLFQRYIDHQHNIGSNGLSFGYHAAPSVVAVTASPHELPTSPPPKHTHLPLLSLDILRQGWQPLRYDSPTRSGLQAAAVEHAWMELLRFALPSPLQTAQASVFSIFYEAKQQKIPLRLIHDTSQLAKLALSSEQKALLAAHLRGHKIIVPERPVLFHKRPRLAWLRIHPTLHQWSDHLDTGGRSAFTEYMTKLEQELDTAPFWGCFFGVNAGLWAIAAVNFSNDPELTRAFGYYAGIGTILSPIFGTGTGCTTGTHWGATAVLWGLLWNVGPDGRPSVAPPRPPSTPSTTPPTTNAPHPPPPPRRQRRSRPQQRGPQRIQYQHRSSGTYEIRHR